jgi:TonB family protein
MVDLSSAEDMNPLAAAAPVSPSDQEPEEFSVEPDEAQAPPSVPAPTLKAKMVAHQVHVKATGAHPGKTAGQLEPFTEETTSVLVCETGGVICLSAAVVPGQLLFLINQDSKREVVAQVIRKRVHRPTSCYVELEFAEPAPRFWGTEFSAASAMLPKDAKEAEIAALVISAEATADELVEPPPAVTAEEVQALKRQVEAVRESPKPLNTPAASEQAPSMELVPAHAQLPPEPPPPRMEDPIGTPPNSITDSNSAPAMVPTSSLPIEQNPVPAPIAAPGQVAPQIPPIDFSLSLPKPKRSLRARGNFTPGFRGGVLRLAVLTTALVITILGAAWYKHWIPWKSAAKNTPLIVPLKPANTNTSGQPENPEAVEARPASSNPRVGATAAVPARATPSESVALSNTSAPEKPDTTDASTQSSAAGESVAQPAVRKTSPSPTLAAKRLKVVPTAKTASDSAIPSEADAAIVPPKLISSVKAVASLDALRDFERGNVVIDAVVGTDGEVTSMNVLSGPPSLRASAVETLKQYRYEPATLNGQPVPAHVTVTIRFRFEP